MSHLIPTTKDKKKKPTKARTPRLSYRPVYLIISTQPDSFNELLGVCGSYEDALRECIEPEFKGAKLVLYRKDPQAGVITIRGK